jgi:hypothetical protein
MPTNSFLTYCSYPLPYSLRSKLPKAIEYRWNKFPNRYKDEVVAFVYESKETNTHPIAEDDTLRDRNCFYHVRFLRPPRLSETDLHLEWGKANERRATFALNGSQRF